MKEFRVYFDLFGKKMVATVSAKNEDEAKEIIRSKIKFHKIETGTSKDFPTKEFDAIFENMDKLMKKIFG